MLPGIKLLRLIQLDPTLSSATVEPGDTGDMSLNQKEGPATAAKERTAAQWSSRQVVALLAATVATMLVVAIGSDPSNRAAGVDDHAHHALPVHLGLLPFGH